MTPDQRIAHLAARQHGVFTRAQAVDRGLTPAMVRRRVATSRWSVVHRGVFRLSGAVVGHTSRAMAACLATGGSASHRTAARLFGLGNWPSIEVIVPRGRRTGRPGIAVHETSDLRPGDLAIVSGVPTTSPTRTLLDIARVLDPDELEAVVDHAFVRRLTSPERVQRRLSHAAPGRGGIAILRALLGESSGCLDSHLEAAYLRMFRRAGIPVVPQHEVAVGGRRFRLDFAIPEARLAIEIDGLHHSDARQWRSDVERQNALVCAGWTPLRFTGRDRHRPQWVVDRVTEVLARVVAV